jgi:hypothetical protein
MISEWKQYLENLGFKREDRTAFLRASTPISHWVYETSLGVGKKDVRINVAIQVNDPFAREQPHGAAHIVGEVTGNEIVVNYNSAPHWLKPTQKEAAFTTLRQCSVAWFIYWIDLRHVIQYLEEPVECVQTVLTGISEAEHIFGNRVTKPRHIPAWDHLLSLLYYHIGNRDKSVHYTRRWLGFVQEKIVLSGEPERTLRQMKALEKQKHYGYKK